MANEIVSEHFVITYTVNIRHILYCSKYVHLQGGIL